MNSQILPAWKYDTTTCEGYVGWTKPRSSSDTGRSLFLEHSQPFGEPPWHAMVSRREHVHMTQLVPHRAGPVKAPRLARAWRIHRNDVSERHAERPQTRHAHRPHGEIVVIGIDLHLHRTL